MMNRIARRSALFAGLILCAGIAVAQKPNVPGALPSAAAPKTTPAQGSTPAPGTPAARMPTEFEVKGTVQLIHDVEIPAEADGRLTELSIVDGSVVAENAVLAVIDDRQARLTLRLKQAQEVVAEMEANNDVKVRNAINTERVAQYEAQIFTELANQNAAKDLEARKKRLEAEQAKLSIELVRIQKDQASGEFDAKKVETELAQWEIDRRNIRAPFAGIIAERFVQKGEWVQAGAKIARLINLEKLRIEGSFDSLNATTQALMNAPVDVTVHLTASRDLKLQSKVTFVKPEVYVNTHKCLFRCEIENQTEGGQWIILPGMAVDMVVRPKTELAAQPR